MDRRLACVSCAMLAFVFAAGCCGTGPMPPACPPPAAAVATQWMKSEVYFGRDLPGGGQVSPAQWAEFLNKVVTPRFPKGLTIHDTYGQMQHADGRIERQSTWVVVILHPQDPAVTQSIQEVIDAYRKQFNKAQVAFASTGCVSTSFYAE